MKTKLTDPSDDVNKAFEAKEKAETLHKAKKKFVLDTIDGIADDPQLIFKGNAAACKKVDTLDFKKTNITLEIVNEKKLTVKITAIVDGKKFITLKTFKP